jgi:hypothetical protein
MHYCKRALRRWVDRLDETCVNRSMHALLTISERSCVSQTRRAAAAVTADGTADMSIASVTPTYTDPSTCTAFFQVQPAAVRSLHSDVVAAVRQALAGAPLHTLPRSNANAKQSPSSKPWSLQCRSASQKPSPFQLLTMQVTPSHPSISSARHPPGGAAQWPHTHARSVCHMPTTTLKSHLL